MKKTEQYGLNQWELPDPILMSDFNADNAKIAAALAEFKVKVEDLERRKFQRRKFYRETSSCTILHDAFTDVDWNQFSRVHFVLDIYTTTACTLYPYVFTCRDIDSIQIPASSTPRRTLVQITLFPGRLADDLAWATIASEAHCVTRVFDFPFRSITIAGVRADGRHILTGSSTAIFTEG